MKGPPKADGRTGSVPGNLAPVRRTHPAPSFLTRVGEGQARLVRSSKLHQAATLTNYPPHPPHVRDMGDRIQIGLLKCRNLACSAEWISIARNVTQFVLPGPCPKCGETGTIIVDAFPGILEINAKQGVARYQRVRDGIALAPWHYLPWDAATLLQPPTKPNDPA